MTKKSKIKRILSSLVPLLVMAPMIFYTDPRSVSFTASIPETLPSTINNYNGAVEMTQSAGDSIGFTFTPSDYWGTYIFAGLAIIFCIISYTQYNNDPRAYLHPIAKANSANDIKAHPFYPDFLAENEEFLYIYKDELPEKFAAWLVNHTAKFQ